MAPLVVTNLDHVVELVAFGIEGCGADLATLVEQVHGEELSLAAGVTPSADAGLGRDTGTDRPPQQQRMSAKCSRQ